MAGHTGILLGGESIFLAGIGVRRALLPHFDVVCRRPSERVPAELTASPNAVSFDIENGQLEDASRSGIVAGALSRITPRADDWRREDTGGHTSS